MTEDWKKRTDEMMTTIHGYGGLLARRHIKQIFFYKNLRNGQPIKGWQAMRKRLKKLRDAQYISFPTRREYRQQPIPEPVLWLDWKGILVVAQLAGVEIEVPKNPKEKNLQSLEQRLRKEHKIRWLRKLRSSQTEHDLISVDLRMAIEKSIEAIPYLSIEKWVTESDFRSEPDEVPYTAVGRHGEQRQEKARVYPDGYVMIRDSRQSQSGAPSRARYLLEIDNATHANAVFANEKVRRFGAYIRSPVFRKRFGDNRAYVLCVTKSLRRLNHLMNETKKTGGRDGKFFLFTTFKDLWIDPLQMEAVRLSQRRGDWPPIEPYQVNVLTAPAWSMVGEPQKISLFTR